MQASFAARGLLTRPRAYYWASHGSLQTIHRMWLSASCIYHHIYVMYNSTKHRLNIHSVLKLSYLAHISHITSFGFEWFSIILSLDEPMLPFEPAAVVSTLVCDFDRQSIIALLVWNYKAIDFPINEALSTKSRGFRFLPSFYLCGPITMCFKDILGAPPTHCLESPEALAAWDVARIS